MVGAPPPTTFERSTIEDVANAAGVSVATVSRALRGLPNVAVATRARVEEAARELNYRADPAASRLAAGRSRTIAVVVPQINSWYFSNVVAGAEAVCAEDGYDLLVVTASHRTSREDVIATAEDLHRRVDGMIFVEVTLAPDDVETLRRRHLGVVTVGHATGAYPSVRIDNVQIGVMAADHLLRLGHRRIGIIGDQAEDPAWFDVPGERIAGAAGAMGGHGVELDPSLVAEGEFTVDGGHDAALTILRRPERPSAIFALSDEMAFGALVAARELHLRVPDDLSVIGVDDHDVSQVLGLTTVRQRVVEHGAAAARALLRRLGGEPANNGAAAVQPLELVRRTSTRAVA
jgi:LacI family transcriptional regulator, repressor for deo operon, udp, cdd, tsx, nupC, and nupG